MLIPRGIKNNNPLNIRHSSNKWQGESSDQFDDNFVNFTTPVWGIRAAMKTLMTYQKKYNLHSIWEIIKRWAPQTENPTDSYAQNVAKMVGIGINDDIDIISDSSKMIKMVQAMVVQENGHTDDYPNWIYKNEPFWYPGTVYVAAWSAANGVTNEKIS